MRRRSRRPRRRPAGWSTSNNRTADSSSPASPGSRRPTRSSRSPRTRSSRPSGTRRRRGTRSARVETNGHDALHYIDDLVDGTTAAINAGSAAKVIVLVAKPLGLVVDNFNPDGDTGEEPRARRSTAARSRTARTARSTRRPTPRSRRSSSTAACRRTPSRSSAPRQEASGGWDFNGEPTGERRRRRLDVDRDPGARGGRRRRSRTPICGPGSRILADHQRGRRCVGVVRQPRPELDVHGDLRDHCGRLRSGIAVLAQRRAARRTGQPYTSPMVWLRSQQNTGVPTPADAGRINSPSDSFGVSTFATSQSIQAFRRGWNPVSPLEPQACP